MDTIEIAAKNYNYTVGVFASLDNLFGYLEKSGGLGKGVIVIDPNRTKIGGGSILCDITQLERTVDLLTQLGAAEPSRRILAVSGDDDSILLSNRMGVTSLRKPFELNSLFNWIESTRESLSS